jgi:hypothetical protein
MKQPPNPELALAVQTPKAIEIAAPQSEGLSLEKAFHAIVHGELDAAKLSVMKDLLAMDAERKFNAAFVNLQADLPVIVASTQIPNRGKYERYEDVMRVVSPLLTKHGFTVAFSMDFKDNRIIETCTLSHAGHSRSNSFAVRSGKADSDTQADCKAATTAKRNALLNALNIVVRQDCLNNEEDIGIEGDPNAKITEAQAFELENRAALVHANIPALLKYAKVTRFDDIPANKYDELDQLLRRKEQAVK